MSKKTNWFKVNLGKYWFFQILVIGTLITYSLVATLSLVVLVNDSNFGQGTNTTDNSVVVSIIFESKDSSEPITWNSLVTDAVTNSTLYTVMNDNLQLNATYNSGFGYLITGINSLLSKDPNFWTYYYYMKGSGWIYATKGVSNFYLTHSYQFKWVYGPASV